MGQITKSVYIHEPPETVWRLYEDLSRIPEYVHFVRDIFEISDHPAREGTTYKERAKPGPRESISEWRITRCEAPRVQVHEGSMPEMEATLTIELQPEEGGTRIVQSMDYAMLPKVRPLGKLLEAVVVNRKMSSDFENILNSVKSIVESERESGNSATPPSE